MHSKTCLRVTSNSKSADRPSQSLLLPIKREGTEIQEDRRKRGLSSSCQITSCSTTQLLLYEATTYTVSGFYIDGGELT